MRSNRFFISNTRTGVYNTVWVSVIAMILAPVFIIIAGINNIFVIIAISLGAMALAFVLYAIRGLVGGVKGLTITDEKISILRSKRNIDISWGMIDNAKFETINTTPWLTLITTKKKHLICLENFKEVERTEITKLVMDKIPNKTTSTEDWIVMNRIPVSIISKGIEVIRNKGDNHS